MNRIERARQKKMAGKVYPRNHKAKIAVIRPHNRHSVEAVLKRLPPAKDLEEILVIAVMKDKEGAAETYTNMTLGSRIYYLEAVKWKTFHDS